MTVCTGRRSQSAERVQTDLLSERSGKGENGETDTKDGQFLSLPSYQSPHQSGGADTGGDTFRFAFRFRPVPLVGGVGTRSLGALATLVDCHSFVGLKDR